MKKIVEKYNKQGKYEVLVPFEKRGVEKEWLGVVDAREPGEYELAVIAHHKARETGGRITVRAVVGRGATLKLTGLIKIEKNAQRVDDFLELRVLLVDPTAKATAEPKLEIEADDVRASHAASVGQIDESQIMYMMSRGMVRELAEEQIVEGFLLG